MTGRRFALLDRDGTMIVEKNYLSDPRDVELIPGTAQALRQLSKMGLGLLVITNQSGVGRGYFDDSKLALIHQRLVELLAGEGIHLDGIYYCPHKPEDECLCRKPGPALVRQAAAKHGFDPRLCFVIGDKPCDIELGRNVGATTILVRTGYGDQLASQQLTRPDHVVSDVAQAAQVIKRLLASDEGSRTTSWKSV